MTNKHKGVVKTSTLTKPPEVGMTTAMGAAFWTLAEVAAHYRTTLETVRHWRKIGYGPQGVKIGTRVLVPAAEIARFDAEIAAQAVAE